MKCCDTIFHYMAQRGLNQEAVDGHARSVLDQVFIQPTPYRTKLVEQGVAVGELDPIGVATAVSLQMELELMGIKDRTDRRAVATAITHRFNRGLTGDYLRLPPTAGLEHLEADGIYYRRDIGSTGIRRRYDAYKAVLDEEVATYRSLSGEERAQKNEARDAVRRERLEKKRQEEEALKAARNRPSTAGVFIYAPFSNPDFSERVEKLKTELNPGVLLEQIVLPVDGFSDTTARVVHSADIRRILEFGLTPEQLNQILPRIREGVIKGVETLEEYAKTLAESVTAQIDQKLKVPAKDWVIAVNPPRPLLHPFRQAMTDASDDRPVAMEEAEKFRNDQVPYGHELVEWWSRRFDPDFLRAVDQNPNDPDLDPKVKNLLARQDAAAVFKTIRTQGAVEVEGEMIERAELEARLEPSLITYDMLTEALMTDVLGEIYPVSYTFLNEEGDARKRETGLVYLRTLVGEGSGEAIVKALTPPDFDPADALETIGQIKLELGAKQSELNSVRGQDAQKRKKLLSGELAELRRQLAAKVAESRRTVTVADQVRKTIDIRVPLQKPKPADYRDGEASRGFTDARRRFEIQQASSARAIEPHPEEYREGADSLGYIEAAELYTARHYVKTEGWGPANVRRAATITQTLPTLVSEPVLK